MEIWRRKFRKNSQLFILRNLRINNFIRLIYLIIKANYLNVWLYHFLVPILLLGILLNKELIIHLRQDIKPRFSLNKFQNFSLMFTKFASYFLWRKITLIGNSKRSLESHIKFGIKYKNAYINSNQIDNNFLKNNLIISPNYNKINILTLARLDKSKNLPLELTLFQLIDDLYDFDFKLHIVGDNIDSLLKNQNLRKFPKWLNIEKGKNISCEFFDHYDYYISLSLWEGQSNSIHEAASRGLYIITTKNGDSDLVARNCKGTILEKIILKK